MHAKMTYVHERAWARRFSSLSWQFYTSSWQHFQRFCYSLLPFDLCLWPFDLFFPPYRATVCFDEPVPSGLRAHRLPIQSFHLGKCRVGGTTASEDADDGMPGVALQADVAVVARADDGGVKAGKRVTKEPIGNTIQRARSDGPKEVPPTKADERRMCAAGMTKHESWHEHETEELL
jgi:hypothetical protein